MKKVAFIELQPTHPNIGSYTICPTYGPILLATILNQKGYEAVVYVEGITKIEPKEFECYDIICFSIQTPAANKSYKLAQQLKEKNKIIIFGGAHPTLFPEDCLNYCDYVVRGEGDDILPNLLQCIEHQGNMKMVKGVSYSKNSTIIQNEPASVPVDLSCPADYTTIKDLSFWQPLRRIIHKKILTLPIQSSRGCPNNCSFCVVKDLFGNTYRKRPINTVIDEIKSALQFTKHIYFVDNNFSGSIDNNSQYTKNLLKTIIKEKLPIKAAVFVTIDIAENMQLLRLMKSAGIKLIMIGFESIDRRSLEIYHKNQTPSTMEENVKILKKYFTILGSFMAGSNGEDEHIISLTVDLAVKWGIDQLYYFVLSPYPNMKEIIPPQRVFLSNWDYGTGMHIYFFPKNITPSNLQNSIINANRTFYSYWRILKYTIALKINKAINLLIRRFLFEKITNSILTEYIPTLKNIEKDLYIKGNLSEQELKSKKIKKIKYWNNINQ